MNDYKDKKALKKMFKFIDPNDNVLHRVADLLDDEIEQYIIDILNGYKKIEGIDIKAIRDKLFTEHRKEIIDKQIDFLEKKNKELSEYNIELINKKAFCLSDSQEEKVKNWKKNHKCSSRGKSQGAIGGQYTYEFSPTSIGVFCSVKCSCGEKIDISDVF